MGKITWRRDWLATPVFLLGECHGQRSLKGYNPCDKKESDMIELKTLSLHLKLHRLKCQLWKWLAMGTYASYSTQVSSFWKMKMLPVLTSGIVRTENHIHRKLTNLTTWTTDLSNSMKLWANQCRATQDGWVMVEHSGKTWSTREGNANHFSILALGTPWTVWKGKMRG